MNYLKPFSYCWLSFGESQGIITVLSSESCAWFKQKVSTVQGVVSKGLSTRGELNNHRTSKCQIDMVFT